jgi:hypothetical protein
VGEPQAAESRNIHFDHNIVFNMLPLLFAADQLAEGGDSVRGMPFLSICSRATCANMM